MALVLPHAGPHSAHSFDSNPHLQQYNAATASPANIRRPSPNRVRSASPSNSSPPSHSQVVPAYPYNVSMTPFANGQQEGPVPDDTAVKSRLPSICVDYLSHDWAEDDVWTSWKQMTKMKHEIANGVRLENASWRTWAKQRGALKTISPETLNWLKDSDVTWLYGPLHTAVEPVPLKRAATAEERLGLDDGGHKSILKHRSLSEVLLMAGPPSPLPESSKSSDDDDDDDDEEEDDDLSSVSSHDSGARPRLVQTHSDSSILPARRGHNKNGSPPRLARRQTSPEEAPPTPVSALRTRDRSAGGSSSSKGRHISFSHRVEQCIAVDTDDHRQSTSTEHSDEEALTFRSSPRNSFNNPLGRTRRRRSHSPRDTATIAKLAPTTLKSSELLPAPSPAVVYHDQDESDSARGASAGPTVSASPSSHHPSQYDEEGPNAGGVSGNWHEDEDDDSGGIAFDYFSGPDLGVGDEYNMNGNSAAGSHSASSSGSSSPSTPKPQAGRSILKSRNGKSRSANSSSSSGSNADSNDLSRLGPSAGDLSPDSNSRGRSTLRRNGSSSSSLDRTGAADRRGGASSISPPSSNAPSVTIATAAGSIGRSASGIPRGASSDNKDGGATPRSYAEALLAEESDHDDRGVGSSSSAHNSSLAERRPFAPDRYLTDHDGYDSDDAAHLFDSPAIPGSPAATDLERNTSFTSLHHLRWSDEPNEQIMGGAAVAGKRGNSPRSPTAATFGVPGRGSSGLRSRSSLDGQYTGRGSGDDYSFYSDDESGVVGRTIEIAGTAKDLVGALWNVGMNTFWRRQPRQAGEDNSR